MEHTTEPWLRNRFIKALKPETRDLLKEHSLPHPLALKTVLFVEHETPRFAYFPLSGVASVVALTRDGKASEVGFVGCEGLTGAYHLLGPAAVPTRCFVQIEGDFLRMPFAELRKAYKSSEEIRTRLHEFVQADCLSISQMAGCNQMHDLGQRLARWLLMADDRHKSATLGVTHDILAEMIAASRTTVTKIAGEFQNKGLIHYSRGKVRILNRVGLERTACGCYPIAKKLFTDLYKV